MDFLFQPVLANPINIEPAEYPHPMFSPLAISAMEGLLLGIVLLRWTRAKPLIIVIGFLINIVTLTLFWSAIQREEHLWEYDYRIVALGEILVVAVEAIAIVFVVRKFAANLAQSIWWKALGVSLVLNAFSFFTGAVLAYSPNPANKTVQDDTLRSGRSFLNSEF
jgi:hypothetical protein